MSTLYSIGQMNQLGDALEAAGFTPDDVTKLRSSPRLGEIKLVVAGVAKIVVVEHPSFAVLVDYSRTLAQMIAAGRYDWVNPDITEEHFPVKGEGRKTVKVVLFHFNKVMTSDQVIIELDAQGYLPARIEELLGLGEGKPKLQNEFPIIGLGSSWLHPVSDRRVPCLGRYGVGRDLHLRYFGISWCGYCRFAAVCK